MDTARSPPPDAPGDAITAGDILSGVILAIGGYVTAVLMFCL